MTKKYLFLGLLVLSFLVTPLFTGAQSIAELLAKIEVLEQQLLILQSQQGQSGGWCHNFNVSFGVGTRSNEVVNLQTALTREGLQATEIGASSSLYGETTAAAVTAFQLKYRSEILTPLGLTNGTGYVGPSTRRVLNRLYGCGIMRPIPVPGNLPPTISGVSGPTALSVGQTATWTVQASDPENGTLSYSVIWGDEIVTLPMAMSPAAGGEVRQTTTFTHSYNRAATYYPTFTVTDNSGQRAQTRISVMVRVSPDNRITVLTPNGGEQWVANSVRPISWQYSFGPLYDPVVSPKVDLYLQAPMPVCLPGVACAQFMPSPITLDKNIPALSTYNWIVATDIVNTPIAPGQYRVYVCPAGSSSAYSNGCDASDNYFTILSN